MLELLGDSQCPKLFHVLKVCRRIFADRSCKCNIRPFHKSFNQICNLPLDIVSHLPPEVRYDHFSWGIPEILMPVEHKVVALHFNLGERDSLLAICDVNQLSQKTKYNTSILIQIHASIFAIATLP